MAPGASHLFGLPQRSDEPVQALEQAVAFDGRRLEDCPLPALERAQAELLRYLSAGK